MWLHIAVGALWGLGIGAWLWYPGYAAWRSAALISEEDLSDLERRTDALMKHYEL